jgi:hypothetical protein
MNDGYIDMSGQMVRNMQVLDRAPKVGGKTAWWVRCLRCGTEQDVRAGVIRKAQNRPEWGFECRGCGK